MRSDMKFENIKTASFVKAAFLAALCIAALPVGAGAASDGVRGSAHFKPRVENSRRDIQGDGRRNRPSETARQSRGFHLSPAYRTRPHSFYGGRLYAYNVPGNGRYILRDVWNHISRPFTSVSALKIIDVEQEMGGNAIASRACSFEAGVCIIRGSR